MEELLMLKDLLLQGNIPAALTIVDELEEMSRKDIINNIRSHAKILLLHLIKQQAENRNTRSWDRSIRNSIWEIQELNKRPKSAGHYLPSIELHSILEITYLRAIDDASAEVREGEYEPEELAAIINREEIINQALALIAPEVYN
ncbi:hypothetical protein BCD67_20765 [Oscillatoriales cyanobacterium USR001]|nr:hypothetical protein BCD67_20765 [Oscillatoriales cyanobacterium USR001]